MNILTIAFKINQINSQQLKQMKAIRKNSEIIQANVDEKKIKKVK